MTDETRVDMLNEIEKLKRELSSLKGQHTQLLGKYNNFVLTIDNKMNQFYDDSTSLQNFLVDAKKRIIDTINQETRVVLNEKGIRKIVNESIKNAMDVDSIKQLVKDIAFNVSSNLTNALDSDLKRTKSICFTIDNELKHLHHNLPFNHSDSVKIKERIEQKLNKMMVAEINQIKTNNVKKLMEVKKDG